MILQHFACLSTLQEERHDDLEKIVAEEPIQKMSDPDEEDVEEISLAALDDYLQESRRQGESGIRP